MHIHISKKPIGICKPLLLKSISLRHIFINNNIDHKINIAPIIYGRISKQKTAKPLYCAGTFVKMHCIYAEKPSVTVFTTAKTAG
jgi:hypothetical protein